MSSQIRPSRLEVNDRFPVLGFTLHTGSASPSVEIAVAAHPELFRPEARARRHRGNFYASRVTMPSSSPRSEGVYLLPPEVLSRFIGNERLYFALATYENDQGRRPVVSRLPTEGSAYVNIKGLTGRSLRRVRVLPSRTRSANYAGAARDELAWAGDVISPGTEAISDRADTTGTNGRSADGAAAGRPDAGTPGAPVAYDDGFGPLEAAPVEARAPEAPAVEGDSARAQSLAADIPLDPGVGGVSIGEEALQLGDVIVSTTSAIVSRAIRAATGSDVSHAMIYVGQGGQVIEAVGDGVRLIPLAHAIADATTAVVFRRVDLSDEQRHRIADAAAREVGRAYDRVGIVRQALFQLDSSVCSLLPESSRDACLRYVGLVDLGNARNDEFFCSELVIAAFEAAGVALTSSPPHWTTPEGIVELAFARGALAYVGHLKAPPLGPRRSVFQAFGFSAGADASGTTDDLAIRASRFGLDPVIRALLEAPPGPSIVPEVTELLERLVAGVTFPTTAATPDARLAQGQSGGTAELALATFSLLATLAQQPPSGKLSWSRNITSAVHRYPEGAAPDGWSETTLPLLGVDATHDSTLSSAWARFNVVFRHNGNDIDQCRVECNDSSEWTLSSLDVAFEGSDAASYERNGIACVALHVHGRFDPSGTGDVNFEGLVLVRADGTIERSGMRITRGEGVAVLQGSLERPRGRDVPKEEWWIASHGGYVLQKT